MESPRKPVHGDVSTRHTALKEVAEEFGVSARKIKASAKGTKIICAARDELCKRLYDQNYSLNDIGSFLCGRRHSTIFAAIKRATARAQCP